MFDTFAFAGKRSQCSQCWGIRVQVSRFRLLWLVIFDSAVFSCVEFHAMHRAASARHIKHTCIYTRFSSASHCPDFHFASERIAVLTTLAEKTARSPLPAHVINYTENGFELGV